MLTASPDFTRSNLRKREDVLHGSSSGNHRHDARLRKRARRRRRQRHSQLLHRDAAGTFRNFGKRTRDGVTVRGSHATFGGVLMQEPCTGCLTPQLAVTHSLFQNNNADSGGAINLQGGYAVIEDSTFTGNTANGGGAIEGYSNSDFVVEATIARCTFNRN